MEKTYLAIDLKSFYASVECAQMHCDPLDLFLVVADQTRSEKTICLAVSPALKAMGVPGRPRLFEVIQKVKEINAERRKKIGGRPFTGKAFFASEAENPYNEICYVAAMPQMAEYISYSNRIYGIYLKYFAPEDIHVYSVDEVFIDAAPYLHTYQMSPHDLCRMVIQDILRETGITATAGIGSNLYLAKVAMDIIAKKVKPDQDGVRIAQLDEISYRKLLWNHLPLTDFWRVGPGIAKRMAALGLYTMGDIARCSMGGNLDPYNEDLIYQALGINAELLIDHAWGYESCTIADIKSYHPEVHSLQSGQVLPRAYSYEHARVVIKEMVDQLVLDMSAKHVVSNSISLAIGYDISNMNNPAYEGDVVVDFYGRQMPKGVHGGVRFEKHICSYRQMREAVLAIYDTIVDPSLLIRRIFITAGDIVDEKTGKEESVYEQMDLFSSISYEQKQKWIAEERKEQAAQQAVNRIRHRFGKNSVVKLVNLDNGANQMERNMQIGGHRA